MLERGGFPFSQFLEPAEVSVFDLVLGPAFEVFLQKFPVFAVHIEELD